MLQKELVKENLTLENKVNTYKDIPLTRIRKIIAKSMQQSLSQMAQLTHNASFDATEILNLRKEIKNDTEKWEHVTLNDIVLFAVAKVLKLHKEMNAHFLEDKIRIFDNINLGIAVDTPKGLLVPTIFNADKFNLNELSLKTKELIALANSGKIPPNLLNGATFTVTNLGALNIDTFTPIINPPQVGILGVNKIQTKVKIDNGEMVPYQSMSLSLTYDHRALDGAPASKFLNDLCKVLENFSSILK